MKDLCKRFSASMDHLHDLVFDRYDETDSPPFAASYHGIIYREGYLFKQSRKMWKFWKTRYFVLRSDGLFYYRSIAEKDGRPLGVIPLRRLSVHLDTLKDKGKPKYCLRMGSGYGFKTFYCLCCFSNEERNLWFTSLLTAISQDLISNYSLKCRSYRSSSGSSSSDSVLSEPSSSPNPTLESTAAMPRTTSCELGSIFRVTEHLAPPAEHRRPTSLSSLSELNTIQSSQTLGSPKKTRKPGSNPFRRLKALSSLDFKGWRGSYIDLSA